MPNKKLSDVRAIAPRTTIIGGEVTIGSSGAISDQTSAILAGGVATQTGSEDGRYTIAFGITCKRVLAHGCTMVGTTDTAQPTTTGVQPFTRNLSTTGFDVQFLRTDTSADADPASGTVFSWWAIVALK